VGWDRQYVKSWRFQLQTSNNGLIIMHQVAVDVSSIVRDLDVQLVVFTSSQPVVTSKPLRQHSFVAHFRSPNGRCSKVR